MFDVELYEFSENIFWILIYFQMIICKYLLPFRRLPFCTVHGFFCGVNFIIYMISVNTDPCLDFLSSFIDLFVCLCTSTALFRIAWLQRIFNIVYVASTPIFPVVLFSLTKLYQLVYIHKFCENIYQDCVKFTKLFRKRSHLYDVDYSIKEYCISFHSYKTILCLSEIV